MDSVDMRLRLANAAAFQKFDGRKNQWVVVDPPQPLAQSVLASIGDWTLPLLEAIAEAPIMRADGSLHDAAGYDPKTRLYYEGSAPSLDVPANPTWEDARAAADILLEPFAEFPFVNPDQDKSVVLAYLVTLAQRPQLTLAPLFGISATSPGTGKGLLAEVCNLIVRGRDAALMPPTSGQGADEETRKRITALLLQGVSSVTLDNWSTALGGDALNVLLTSASWSDRVLAKSQAVTLPARVTWAATGNNLIVRGDMVRRTLLLTLDAGIERPEQRSFKVANLPQYVLSRRSELLSALFTILRAYRVAGEPGRTGPTLGRFEEWSRAVCAPIRWLGYPDPTQSQEELRSDDPETQRLNTLLESWESMIGDRQVTLQELISPTTDTGAEELTDREKCQRRSRLQEALEDVAGGRGVAINTKTLSWYLRKNEGRVCGGRVLLRDKSSTRVQYRVSRSVRVAA
jgi:hypothetical protein